MDTFCVDIRLHLPDQLADLKNEHRSRNMKILAIEQEHPNATPESFQHFAKDEAREVWELHQAGLIRELYFRADKQTAVLVLECDSTGEAEHILAQLPYVRAGLIAFTLVPLKAYPGFARLFDGDHPSRDGNDL